jgi:hypothetical protein
VTEASAQRTFRIALRRVFQASLNVEGRRSEGIGVFLDLGRLRFALVLGDAELVEEEFDQGLLAGGVGGGVVVGLFVQALEVGGGDLQGIELQRRAPGVGGVIVERAHDLEESKLEAHGVLDQAEGVVGALGVDGFVEDAVFASAAGGGGAGGAVHLGVPAAGSVIELGNGHRLIPPPGGGYGESVS